MSAEWMSALTHKFPCFFLIHSTRQEQTHFSTSPLSAFSFVLNAFSHSRIKKKSFRVRLAFAFFSLTCWQGFCMCILWRQISLAGRCFTGFTTALLYPPGTLKQTEITLTCLSSSFYSHTGYRHLENWTMLHITSWNPITSNDYENSNM